MLTVLSLGFYSGCLLCLPSFFYCLRSLLLLNLALLNTEVLTWFYCHIVYCSVHGSTSILQHSSHTTAATVWGTETEVGKLPFKDFRLFNSSRALLELSFIRWTLESAVSDKASLAGNSVQVSVLQRELPFATITFISSLGITASSWQMKGFWAWRHCKQLLVTAQYLFLNSSSVVLLKRDWNCYQSEHCVHFKWVWGSGKQCVQQQFSQVIANIVRSACVKATVPTSVNSAGVETRAQSVSQSAHLLLSGKKHFSLNALTLYVSIYNERVTTSY